MINDSNLTINDSEVVAGSSNVFNAPSLSTSTSVRTTVSTSVARTLASTVTVTVGQRGAPVPILPIAGTESQVTTTVQVTVPGSIMTHIASSAQHLPGSVGYHYSQGCGSVPHAGNIISRQSGISSVVTDAHRINVPVCYNTMLPSQTLDGRMATAPVNVISTINSVFAHNVPGYVQPSSNQNGHHSVPAFSAGQASTHHQAYRVPTTAYGNVPHQGTTLYAQMGQQAGLPGLGNMADRQPQVSVLPPNHMSVPNAHVTGSTIHGAVGLPVPSQMSGIPLLPSPSEVISGQGHLGGNTLPGQPINGHLQGSVPMLPDLRTSAVDQGVIQSRLNEVRQQAFLQPQGEFICCNAEHNGTKKKKVHVPWPNDHVFVGPSRTKVTYAQLNMEQFVYGYLKIVELEKSALVRAHMIDYLTKFFQNVCDYGWTQVKGAHQVVLTSMEDGILTWENLKQCNKLRKSHLVGGLKRPLLLRMHALKLTVGLKNLPYLVTDIRQTAVKRPKIITWAQSLTSIHVHIVCIQKGDTSVMESLNV